MTVDYGAALAKTREILQTYNKSGVEIGENTEIRNDLHIDSVDVMDLLMVLEDEYDISIPINALAEVNTVGQLARAVSDLLEKS